MKSLALHLITILLLGSLHISTNNNKHFSILLMAATASASSSSSSLSSATVHLQTTTLQTPSLHAPHRVLPVTPTTKTTATTALPAAASIRQQQQQKHIQLTARRSLSSLAHANSVMTDNSIPNVVETTTFASTRLVRNANAGITNRNNSNNKSRSISSSSSNSSNSNANSVRQNRSLQSATSSERNSNSNNNNNSIHKSKLLDRRHHFRMHQSSASTTTSTSTTTTTTPSTASASAATTPIVFSSRSFAHEHQSMSTFMAANNRQSKQQHQHHSQSSLPLVDGVKRAPAETTNTAAELSSLPAAIKNTTTTKLHQTPKTPRMIQRLVAGHIQNAEGRSTYKVSVVTTNSTVSNSSTTLKPAPLYYRRKEPVLSSSYRHGTRERSTTTRTFLSDIATTTAKPLRFQSIQSDDNIDDEDRDDDEALLDDPGDFDSWDNGILRLSAGAGKESSAKSKKSKDDSKKTLSDQVRDGKYGLIEKELFRRPPKRPGVLSYLPNKEVPYDNERNYGGLNEEDIWLAEDHLLVIKGGSLNEDEHNEPWSPIDDYDAPGRQIKLPPNPKVPPPFPVQLEENGPVQFVGNNKFTVVYPIANESIPIYPAGPETNYPPSESDRDDEKNLLARTGSAQDIAEGEPGYHYPAPYPPWLYHNQTFVNPFLSNARPITFPGLGPFPFGHNASLESANVTDYFDEDDPSLYYPPAYSFVYKSNYTNPVPPGPLVPGIVLPPPANQFSRLEKSEKQAASTTSSPPPARHRTYTTTSTTTTTSTPSTTTQFPYRQQVITRITEYTPKTIIITPAPQLTISSSIPSPTSTTKLPPTPPPTPSPSRTPPPPSPPSIIESVPVPVAIPIPVYPSNKYPTSRPSIVSFVPTTPEPERGNTLTQSNPIYYEYFEAKRQPPVTPALNVIDDFLSTTQKPVTAAPIKPIKIYATSKRPFKSQHSHRNYLNPVPPNRQFVQENIVYITPKPEIRYKRPQVASAPQAPIFKPRPLQNFEREVNAIRETLRYYQNQQLRDNNIPRTAKAKPIYEYTFDATKNLEPVQPTVSPGNFQPPTEYDVEPFKPMVTYSPPIDDENSFRAIAVDKLDGEVPSQQQSQPKYQSTTTLIPVQPEATYQAPQGRSKKLRIGAKYLQQQQHQQPLVAEYREQPAAPQQPEFQYQTTPRTILTTQPPWISLDKQQQQEFNDYAPQLQQQQQQQPQSERLQLPPQAKHRGGFPGYYYGPPPPPRQNNRFYDEPFQNAPPVRKIVNYRPQQQPQQPQQQHQQQQSNVWSLENDTYVNFAPNRPPLNPDAEFINPYQTLPVNPYANQGQRYPPPAPISHQSQYYAPPQRLPPQQLPPQRQYQPLHRDILVNYRQPLPPINPDSEYISHPQVVRNQANQIYRSNAYRLPPQQQQQQQPQLSANNGGDDSPLYYITPKYRRSNANNHNNDNSRNDNNNGK